MPSNYSSSVPSLSIERNIKLQSQEYNTSERTSKISTLSKRINPGYYQLSYLIARIRWNTVITVFHTLKYNKKASKREEYRSENNIKKKHKSGFEELSTIIKKIENRKRIGYLDVGFRRIFKNLCSFRVQ